MHFHYVGPADILADSVNDPMGTLIKTIQDILDWRAEHLSELNGVGGVTATYTIGTDGDLRLATRHSEHVACAGGGPVLAAGELTVYADGRVDEISNQSTGFCPSEDCWPVVETALNHAEISHPSDFSNTCIFRKCQNCSEHNLVKDDWFVCTFCDADLPKDWNFD